MLGAGAEMSVTESAGGEVAIGHEPAALATPTRRVRRGFQAVLALTNLALWMAFLTPGQVLIPEQLDRLDPAHKIGDLAWITAGGAACALLASPIAGALSDRTGLRLGRRHPWTLAGALVAGMALLLTGAAPGVGLLLAGWCLTQLALNAMLASLTAMVPDQVPVGQRGVVSALLGIGQPVGLVTGTALVATVVTGMIAGYGAIALLLCLAALVLVLTLPDLALPRGQGRPLSLRTLVGGFWVDPRRHPDYGWAWLTRFLVMLGQGIVIGYLLYFLEDSVHYSRLFPGHSTAEGVAILSAAYAGALLLTTVSSGALSDRLGRRKVFVIAASLVIAAGMLVVTVSTTWPAALVSAVVMGAGFGVYMSVDVAMVTQVLPAAGDRARDLGLINIANTLPQLVAPAIAAPLISGPGGYHALFLTATLVTLAGAVLVQPIRGVR
jgi:MFS family permease